METQDTKRGRRFRYSDAPAPTPVLTAVRFMAPKATAPAIGWEWIWVSLAGAGICLAWFYWRCFVFLEQRWISNAGWSHGFVVPLISLFFIRMRWDALRVLTPNGSFSGVAVLLVGVIGQVLFSATGQQNLWGLSLMVVLFGLTLFVFGWEHLKILWLPIAFLGFAMPPPDVLYNAMTLPMQHIAAQLGVYLLPLFGFSGECSGTVIQVWYGGGQPKTFGVEEACAGMRMLVAFFALAVALAYSTDRPIWQKVLLAACALPVAILCNGFRVALTGVMGIKLGDQWAGGTAHQFLGLLMLGPALVLQLLMAWILDRIFVESDSAPEAAPA